MSNDSQSPLGAFDLKKFISLCFKSWYIFAAAIGLCLGFAVVISILQPAKKEVFAQIMLKDGGGMGLAGQIASSYGLGDMFGGSSTTDNESGMMRSHTVFLQTVKQMGLNTSYYARPFPLMSRPVTSSVPFLLTPPEMCADTLSLPIAFEVKRNDQGLFNIKMKVKGDIILKLSDQKMPVAIDSPYGHFDIATTEHYDPETTQAKYNIVFMSYNAAASRYEKLVNIYVPDRKSDFIDLSFVTDDTRFGKSLLNHIIENYTALSNVFRDERSAENLKLVDDRLASLSSDLLQSEDAIERFKIQHNLTDVEADANYIMSKTGSIEASLLEAQTNYELVKLTREFLRNPENNFSLIPDLFMNSAALNSENGSLISQYNQLILERMQLSDLGKTTNSTVRQLDAQIDALRANILSSVDRVYQNASITLNDLKKEDIKNKSRLGSLPAIERQYLVLKRDNMLQEQLYLYLLQQREELNMTMVSRSYPAQVVDYPYVLAETPGLSTKIKIALAVFIGLLFGAAYVFFLKMRKAPVDTRAEAEKLIKAPVLQYLATQPDGASASFGQGGENDEAFRHLRSDVQLALKECQGHTAVVSSMHAADGKTYVAVQLAQALAVIGKSVVLVDAALRAPSVARALGVSAPHPDLAETLRSESASAEVQSLKLDNGMRLDLILSGAPAADGGDLVASSSFSTLVKNLSQTYDYVIIDASKISGISDIFYLTDLADMTLVVVRGASDTPSDIDALNNLYQQARLKRLAVVCSGMK